MSTHDALITLDELTERVGMSVRNIRFYTSRGLVPTPIKNGRQGYYSDDHVARLELVQELQINGFTLSAIEKYMSGIPCDAPPEDIALRRAMLTPWQHEPLVPMSRTDLESRAGRELSAPEIDSLVSLGIVMRTTDGQLKVSVSQLTAGLGLLNLGYPVEAAEAAAEVYRRHGTAVADELNEIFRTMVAPTLRESGLNTDRLREVLEWLKPLTVAGLVTAYSEALASYQRERESGD